MNNTLAITEHGRKTQLQVPSAKSAAAEALWKIMPRMDRWLPANRESEKAQFFMAISAAANSMPHDVSKGSLIKSAFNCCALGLMPNTAHGYCHFVPLMRDKGKPTQRREIELWIGYRGFLELAYACGFLSGLTTEVVLEGEEFKRWNDGAGAHVHHIIPIDRMDERRIKMNMIEGAYCCYQTTAGYQDVELVGGQTLSGLANRQRNVWYTDPLAMCRKTPVRRAAKRWRISGTAGQHLASAIMLDEQAERGAPQSLLNPEDSEAPAAEVEVMGPRINLDDLPEVEA